MHPWAFQVSAFEGLCLLRVWRARAPPSLPPSVASDRQDITQEDVKLATAAVARSESGERDGKIGGCFVRLVRYSGGGVAAATGVAAAPSGEVSLSCMQKWTSFTRRYEFPFLPRWTSPRAWCARRGRKRATATRSRSTMAASSWTGKSSTPASTATNPSHSILASDRDERKRVELRSSEYGCHQSIEPLQQHFPFKPHKTLTLDI